MLNLQNAQMMELTAEELSQVEGGFIPNNLYGSGIYPGWCNSATSPSPGAFSWLIQLGEGLGQVNKRKNGYN